MAYTLSLALFTHGKCGPAHIDVDRSRFYFVFTQHSVWTGLHRHVSALALRPAHISYCIYTQLLRALYIFGHYTHARGRTSDWCLSRQNVLECHTLESSIMFSVARGKPATTTC